MQNACLPPLLCQPNTNHAKQHSPGSLGSGTSCGRSTETRACLRGIARPVNDLRARRDETGRGASAAADRRHRPTIGSTWPGREPSGVRGPRCHSRSVAGGAGIPSPGILSEQLLRAIAFSHNTLTTLSLRKGEPIPAYGNGVLCPEVILPRRSDADRDRAGQGPPGRPPKGVGQPHRADRGPILRTSARRPATVS